MLTWNCRSFTKTKKLWLLSIINTQFFPTILCLSEVWTKDNLDSVFPQFKVYYKLRKNINAGGVAICVKEDYDVSVLHCDMEDILVIYINSPFKLVIINAYFPYFEKERLWKLKK